MDNTTENDFRLDKTDKHQHLENTIFINSNLPTVVKHKSENYADGHGSTSVIKDVNNAEISENNSVKGDKGNPPWVNINGGKIKLIVCNNQNTNNNTKRKRRRRKSKRSNKFVSFARSALKLHGAKIGRSQETTRNNNMVTPLVPYNTNKFLMEDHMPEIDRTAIPISRTRDSISIDSDENYFYSLPEDEEEFLTKEFSSVYEDARVERLEGLSKQQLIKEFLQLQSNFDHLSRRYSIRIQNEEKNSERIKKLSSENLELMKQIRSGTMEASHKDRMDSSSADSESDSSQMSSSSSCDSIDCIDRHYTESSIQNGDDSNIRNNINDNSIADSNNIDTYGTTMDVTASETAIKENL